MGKKKRLRSEKKQKNAHGEIEAAAFNQPSRQEQDALRLMLDKDSFRLAELNYDAGTFRRIAELFDGVWKAPLPEQRLAIWLWTITLNVHNEVYRCCREWYLSDEQERAGTELRWQLRTLLEDADNITYAPSMLLPLESIARTLGELA